MKRCVCGILVSNFILIAELKTVLEPFPHLKLIQSPPPLPPPLPLLSPHLSPPLPLPSFSSPNSSWVKKFGEHNGLDVLLNILRSCSSGSYQGKDAILRRIQHQSVRCLKAFMNNKVHWRTSNRCSIEKLWNVFLPPFSPLNSSSSFSSSPLLLLSIPLLSSPLFFLPLLPLSFPPPPLSSSVFLPSPSSSPLLPLPPLQFGLTKMLQSEQGLIIFVSAMDPFNESMMGDVLRVAAAVCLVADG